MGKYSAFEEIDLADYLAVRGRAAEAVAAENPYAAVLISMHTVDLLTAQADLSALSEDDRALHGAFIAKQHTRQSELVGQLEQDPRAGGGRDPGAPLCRLLLPAGLRQHVAYGLRPVPRPIALRRLHPRRDGTLAEILCTPLGDDTYRLSPYPLDQPAVELSVPCREVRGRTFAELESFRSAYAAAPVGALKVRIVS